MRIDWRTIAIVAGAAFVLSFLVGVFGGVQFGVLFLRALLIGALFAGGTVGVGFVVDRFLPELRNTVQADATREPGGTVDIVVDDDPLTADSMPAQLPEGSDFTDSDSEGPEPDTESDGDTGERADEPETDQATEPAFSPGLAAPQIEASGTDDEDVEELPEDTDSESLPDMGKMSESFVAPAEEDKSFADESSGSSGGDPSMMAKAIQTVLKREEA